MHIFDCGSLQNSWNGWVPEHQVLKYNQMMKSMNFYEQELQGGLRKPKRTNYFVGAGASSTKDTLSPSSSPMVARDQLMFEKMRRYDPLSVNYRAPGVASPSPSEKKPDQMTSSEGSSTQQKNELKMKAAVMAASTSSPQSSPKVILLQNGVTGMMTSSSYL